MVVDRNGREAKSVHNVSVMQEARNMWEGSTVLIQSCEPATVDDLCGVDS